MNQNIPLYVQIHNDLNDLISQGYFSKANMLPSEKYLMTKFNVSRDTIRKAVNLLIKDGIVERRQGSGTYINKDKITHNFLSLKSFKEVMSYHNAPYKNNIISFEIITAPEHIASDLHLEEEEKVYFSKVVKCVNGRPIIVENTYMPLNLFPDFSYLDLLNSKYDYVEKKKKLKIAGCNQEIIPVLLNKEHKEIFGIEDDLSILMLKALSFLEDGRIFEHSTSFFNSEAYNFKQTVYR